MASSGPAERTECEDAYHRSGTVHDLHRDEPQIIVNSTDTDSDSELSVGTKQYLEEDLKIKLQRNRKRSNQSTDLVEASNQPGSARSDHVSANGRPLQSQNHYDKRVKCDKTGSTSSFSTSDGERGAMPDNHGSSFSELQQHSRSMETKAKQRRSTTVKADEVHVSIDKTCGTVQIGSNNHINIRRTKFSSKQAKTDTSGQRRKVQIKVPKRVITDDDIDKVAVHLGNDWRRLGMKLGFAKGELDAFEFDNHRTGLHEIIYQMLLAWREKEGVEACIRTIGSQLVAIERPDVTKLLSVK